MISRRSSFGLSAAAVACAAVLAACGGGGSSGGTVNPQPPAPTATPTQASTQQVVTEALPTSAMGVENDPTFGLIGGFTQTLYSQTLAFAPGSQIMVHNGQAGVPHTFGVDSTTAFDANGAALSTIGRRRLDGRSRVQHRRDRRRRQRRTVHPEQRHVLDRLRLPLRQQQHAHRAAGLGVLRRRARKRLRRPVRRRPARRPAAAESTTDAAARDRVGSRARARVRGAGNSRRLARRA